MIRDAARTDQRAEKLLRDFKVVDCSPSNRPVHLSIIGSRQAISTRWRHGQNFATVFVNRQNGRFVQNDALFRRVNDCVNVPDRLPGHRRKSY